MRFRPMYAGANTPNFLHAALDKSPCAPFLKERRMKLLKPTGLDRKSGAMGHPSREEGLGRGGKGGKGGDSFPGTRVRFPTHLPTKNRCEIWAPDPKAS